MSKACWNCTCAIRQWKLHLNVIRFNLLYDNATESQNSVQIARLIAE